MASSFFLCCLASPILPTWQIVSTTQDYENLGLATQTFVFEHDSSFDIFQILRFFFGFSFIRAPFGCKVECTWIQLIGLVLTMWGHGALDFA